MSDFRNEPEDIERIDEDARDDAVMSADDTGMISDERLIFQGETARADEESARESSEP